MPTTRKAEPMFELRKSGIQGRGAFATRRIRKGTKIIEYVGEKITSEAGDERYDDSAMGRHHTFLFSLDDGSVVDAAVGGNESRFINHSCDPNCEALIEKGRIWIHALRMIHPGEELAYDYAYERSDDHTEEDELLYKCRCGADSCRGTILAPPKRKRSKPKRAAKKKRMSRRDTAAKKKRMSRRDTAAKKKRVTRRDTAAKGRKTRRRRAPATRA